MSDTCFLYITQQEIIHTASISDCIRLQVIVALMYDAAEKHDHHEGDRTFFGDIVGLVISEPCNEPLLSHTLSLYIGSQYCLRYKECASGISAKLLEGALHDCRSYLKNPVANREF